MEMLIGSLITQIDVYVTTLLFDGFFKGLLILAWICIWIMTIINRCKLFSLIRIKSQGNIKRAKLWRLIMNGERSPKYESLSVICIQQNWMGTEKGPQYTCALLSNSKSVGLWILTIASIIYIQIYNGNTFISRPKINDSRGKLSSCCWLGKWDLNI